MPCRFKPVKRTFVIDRFVRAIAPTLNLIFCFKLDAHNTILCVANGTTCLGGDRLKFLLKRTSRGGEFFVI